MPEQEEQDHASRKVTTKLRMAARHAIALAQMPQLWRPHLFKMPLQHPVERLARQLARKGQADFDFPCGPDESDIDDTEGLGEEGDPGEEMGEVGGGVLVGCRRASELTCQDAARIIT